MEPGEALVFVQLDGRVGRAKHTFHQSLQHQEVAGDCVVDSVGLVGSARGVVMLAPLAGVQFAHARNNLFFGSRGPKTLTAAHWSVYCDDSLLLEHSGQPCFETQRRGADPVRVSEKVFILARVHGTSSARPQ